VCHTVFVLGDVGRIEFALVSCCMAYQENRWGLLRSLQR